MSGKEQTKFMNVIRTLDSICLQRGDNELSLTNKQTNLAHIWLYLQWKKGYRILTLPLFLHKMTPGP